MAPTKKPAKKKLPPALAKVARAKHAAKVKKLRAKGLAAVALIRERMADVAANLVDIGLALAELKVKGVAAALARRNFAEVCTLDVSMSPSKANWLIEIATRVPRELTTKIGPDRAHALLELADATPADDTPRDLLHAKLKLPSGRVLNVRSASNQQIQDAAKEIRDARAPESTRRGRGFTALPAEKTAYAGFVRRLREHASHVDVRSTLVATRDGKGAKLRIEGRLSELRLLTTALAKAAKG